VRSLQVARPRLGGARRCHQPNQRLGYRQVRRLLGLSRIDTVRNSSTKINTSMLSVTHTNSIGKNNSYDKQGFFNLYDLLKGLVVFCGYKIPHITTIIFVLGLLDLTHQYLTIYPVFTLTSLVSVLHTTCFWWLDILPYIPGLCYLRLFRRDSCRLTMLMKHGFNPSWNSLKNSTCWNRNRKLNWKFPYSGEPLVHIFYVQKGWSAEEIGIHLDDRFNIGASWVNPLRVIRLSGLSSQVSKTILLYVIFVTASNPAINIAIIVVTPIGMIFKYSFKRLFIMVILIILWCDRDLRLVMWFFTLSGINRLFDWLLSLLKSDGWHPNIYQSPNQGLYPAGREGSDEEHRITLAPSRSHAPMPQTSDASLTPEESTAMQSQLNRSNLVRDIQSGNTHAVAANATANLLAEYHNDLFIDNVVLVVGGTFRGMMSSVNGIALQPILCAADGQRYLDGQESLHPGQTLLNYEISTNTLPVGSNKEFYNPLFNVFGAEGAVVYMSHVYDVPIKSLLAVASVNTSETVIVILQMCPAFFTNQIGEMPWTKQKFENMRNGTVHMSWPHTSNEVYIHNRQIILEHVTTDFIQTTENEWWVSVIDKQILDTVAIRWTKVNRKPLPRQNLCFTCKLRDNSTQVPFGHLRTFSLWSLDIEFLSTTKQVEEYIHSSKNFKALGISVRSVTEATARIQGGAPNHIPTDKLGDIWMIETVRRELELYAAPEFNTASTFETIFGFEPDPNTLRKCGMDALAAITRQQGNSIEVPYIRQDRPYLAASKHPNDIKLRTNILTTGGIPAGSFYSNIHIEPYMGRKTHVKLLVSEYQYPLSLNMALFGNTELPTSILPLGTPGLGGSYLSQSGNNLLLSEIVYLIQTNVAAFIIENVTNETKASYCTFHEANDSSSPTPIIIYLTTGPDGTATSRIILRKDITLRRYLAEIGAAPGDIREIPGQAWLPRQNGRAYDIHPSAADENQLLRINFMYDLISRGHSMPQVRLYTLLRTTYQLEFAQLYVDPGPIAGAGGGGAGDRTHERYENWLRSADLVFNPPLVMFPANALVAENPEEVDAIPTHHGIQVYDGGNFLSSTGMVTPAHWYSQRENITFQRRLRY